MGLDIRWYINAKLLEACDDYCDETYDRLSETHDAEPDYVWNSLAFPDASELATGFYESERAGSFRAGSYSGYSRWREQLCQAVHGVEPKVLWESPDDWKGKSFVDLIHFSDCEGTISGNAAKRLAMDFSEHRDAFVTHVALVGDVYEKWTVDRFDLFAKAEVAQNGGYVVFS